MKKSFHDANGILRAWGYMASNGSDTARDEPDDFNLDPGKWKLVNGAWEPHETVIVPQSVSMRQGREALIRRGYFPTVNTYITNMAGINGDIARNEWTMSQVIERTRPLTLAMAQLIDLDAAGMDELFTYASTL